jgi:alpha-ketoglutaric semialdehyde dehydrogenase
MNDHDTFHAINPITNEPLEGKFTNASPAEIDAAVKEAIAAFEVYRKKDKDDIAAFLEQAAEEIMNLGDALLERCHQETALPLPRLQGERGRTVNQLRLFASVVREGSWVDARIDTAQPDRAPIPKPDIRHMLVPLGPVAVFGASNFPLAFSVAGGDTASALAAGCPVIVKGHPAHPGTSKLVAGAITRAVKKTGMPPGTFAMVQGNTNAVGEALVTHPGIKAVGFTGSFRGGKALFDLANARPEPIPVYAEMGSTNPVFLLPAALKENPEKIAEGLSGSVTLGVGQFCTKPGLAFVQKSEVAGHFISRLTNKIEGITAGTMLHTGIKKAYQAGLEETQAISGVELLGAGPGEATANSGAATAFKVAFANYKTHPRLAEETFGPSSVVVEADSKEQLLQAARNLQGHLTATVHGTEADLKEYKELFDILEQKVGRVIINGYPTGVEVCHSMVHGGPFPATTAPRTTSVGTNAIKRFVRPVCYQNFPDSLLPDALKNDNPFNIWRMINGELTKSKVNYND